MNDMVESHDEDHTEESTRWFGCNWFMVSELKDHKSGVM